jgi:hypothetical protein
MVAHLEWARSGPARDHLALAPALDRSAREIAPKPLSAIVSVRYPGFRNGPFDVKSLE